MIEINMDPQTTMQTWSTKITDIIVQLPPIVLDEITYTFAYSVTAQSFDNNPLNGKRELHERYTQMPNLLEPDFRAAPLVRRRLERFIEELPEESVAHNLAKKYLPSVIKFEKMLSEYVADRKQTEGQEASKGEPR